jgi:hypothetical protein
MRHAGIPPVCSEVGIQVRQYLESKEIAIIDSDDVELRRYPLDQQQAALQYARKRLAIA